VCERHDEFREGLPDRAAVATRGRTKSSCDSNFTTSCPSNPSYPRTFPPSH
jgi:hypothetical protein